MNLLKSLINTKLSKIIQGQNGKTRNRVTLKALAQIGWDMPEIRQALVTLNGINVSRLINGHGITPPTLYATLKGKRKNTLAKEILAQSLELDEGELWPETRSDSLGG